MGDRDAGRRSRVQFDGDPITECRLPSDRRSRLLLELFDRAFERQAWHEPTLRGAVRGLALREALWRPGRGRHNIWEIVLHAAYWKFIVRRRLTRDVALAFPRAGSNWPALPPAPDARGWKRDVALLQDLHRRLRTVIARFPAAALDRRGRRSPPAPPPPTYRISAPPPYPPPPHPPPHPRPPRAPPARARGRARRAPAS